MPSRPTDFSFGYTRRSTFPVSVRGVRIGSGFPLVIQSMTDTSTMDTEGSAAQSAALADAGAQLVRLTAQGVREAENLARIKDELTLKGYAALPLVADIHFNPRAAMAAAETADKVRINPGNFVDPGRTFKKIEYTDTEYAAELIRIEEALVPLLERLKARGAALRIGVNHGSLSDRIMSRYGDTPAGIVESALEFLRVCRKHDFNDVVVSVKASNVVVMVETVRRLAAAMDAEGLSYPLHLGVTEAGDAEDGRIKSAVGIGTLLSEGLGDTIRVSLSEPPVNELPVAGRIVKYIAELAESPAVKGVLAADRNSYMPLRRKTRQIAVPEASVAVGGSSVPVVIATGDKLTDDYAEYRRPDLALGSLENAVIVDAASVMADPIDLNPQTIVILTSDHPNFAAEIKAAVNAMMVKGIENPVIAMRRFREIPAEDVVIRASVDLGSLLLNGLLDGIIIDSDALSPVETANLAFAILQATRQRITATEYISCPGCGRTMFDLTSTLRKVKEATAGLRGMKIGVMGCIVNGPGEMADADYGYVGAAAGCVSLYRGRQCVEKNIPEADAPQRLVQLIKSDGNWK